MYSLLLATALVAGGAQGWGEFDGGYGNYGGNYGDYRGGYGYGNYGYGTPPPAPTVARGTAETVRSHARITTRS